MNYSLKPSNYFLKQLDKLDDGVLNIIKEKISFLKTNPFRYKKLVGYNILLFRIRFNDKRKSKRIIYSVQKNNVFIICILDRKKDYKNLRKILIKQEL